MYSPLIQRCPVNKETIIIALSLTLLLKGTIFFSPENVKFQSDPQDTKYSVCVLSSL